MPEKGDGMYPEAHPTAPGGMSMAALRVELVEKHGYKMADVREITHWPTLIDMVAQQRRERELEVAAEEPDNYYPLHPPSPDEMFDAEFEEDADPMCVCGESLSMHTSEHSFVDAAHYGEAEDEATQDLIDAMAQHEAEEVLADETDDEVFDPETMFAEMLAEREADQAANPPLFLGLPVVKDYVFDGHAGAGPSGAERWMNCTMSLTASREFLETLSPNQQRAWSQANTAARQGTTAHNVGEVKANHLLGRVDDDDLETALLSLALEPADGEEYDEEMDSYVEEYVALIGSIAAERGAERVLIEHRVEAAIPLTSASGLHEDEVYVVRGSADCVGLPDPDNGLTDLIVGDLKYGEGIDVDVESNPQIRLYALGVLDSLTDDDGNLTVDVETVTYYIAQPRLGGLKMWSETIDDLLDWRDDVLSPALTLALYGADEGATFNPGELQCQFCPARGRCAALTEKTLAEGAEVFDVLMEHEMSDTEVEAGVMDSERLATLYTQVRDLKKLASDLKDEIERRLHRGETVPGYDLRNYTPPRKWKEGAEEKIMKVRGIPAKEVSDLFRPISLVTPTQAEKILGDENYALIESLIEKPDKKPVVSTGPNDKRSKWEGTPPEAMFDDESTDEDRRQAVEEMFPDD